MAVAETQMKTPPITASSHEAAPCRVEQEGDEIGSDQHEERIHEEKVAAPVVNAGPRQRRHGKCESEDYDRCKNGGLPAVDCASCSGCGEAQ